MSVRRSTYRFGVSRKIVRCRNSEKSQKSSKIIPYSRFMGRYYLVKECRSYRDSNLTPYFLLQDTETGEEVRMHYPLNNTSYRYLPVGYVTYYRRKYVGKQYVRLETDERGEYGRRYTVMDLYPAEGDVEYPELIIVLMRNKDKRVVEANMRSFDFSGGFRPLPTEKM